MVNSSLTYEILMYLNSFYFGMFSICELGMGLLKFINLDYKDDVLIKEAIILVSICLLESIRVHLGRKGSLSDNGYQVWLSVVLTVPTAIGVTFLLTSQWRTFKLEYMLCGLMLTLQVTEFVFAILFLISLCRTPTFE